MEDRKEAMVAALFSQQRTSLFAFLLQRHRPAHEVPDLAQEVYLRMLRVADIDAVRDPPRYLFTIAANLVRERYGITERRPARVSLDDNIAESVPADEPSAADVIEDSQRLESLGDILSELSPKCRAVIVLLYKHEMSYEEIGHKLGVSRSMVKKYRAQALAHCRNRMR